MIGTNARTRRGTRLALALSMALSLLPSCDEPQQSSIRSVPQAEIVESLGTGKAAFVVDVRSRQEFNSGHVPGALLIPLTELPARLEEVREASQEREVVVYCERGGRAMKAGQVLLNAGFPKVGHLEGDMALWRSESRSIEP